MRIVTTLFVILFLIIGIKLVFSDDYIGQIWHLKQGEGGVEEYIIDTSLCVTGDIGQYIVDNKLKYKKYVYVMHSPKGKIIKFDTSDNLTDIIKKQNDNSVSNKKVSKFEYKGKNKKFNDEFSNWKEAKDI